MSSLTKGAKEWVSTFDIEVAICHIQVFELRAEHQRASYNLDAFISQLVVAEVQSLQIRVSDSLLEKVNHALVKRYIVVSQIQTLQCQFLNRNLFYRLLVATLSLQEQIQGHVFSVLSEVLLLEVHQLFALLLFNLVHDCLVLKVAFSESFKHANKALRCETHATHTQDRQILVFDDELLKHWVCTWIDSVHVYAFYSANHKFLNALVIQQVLKDGIDTLRFNIIALDVERNQNLAGPDSLD